MTEIELEYYNYGKKDMRDRIITKLKEELQALRGIQNSEFSIELLEHLIVRIEGLW